MSSKKSKGSGNILVTGGAGYIASHCLISLIETGYDCVVIDNFDNSSTEVLNRVREITQCEESRIKCLEGDLIDLEFIRECFKNNGPFDGCIHFAGFKAVGESVRIPIHYYYNNVVGSLNLLAALKEFNVESLVFSSSCTVYGSSQNVPFRESEPLKSNCPYGATKVHIEQMITDIGVSWKPFRCAMLRYFNPVGAHPSGRIGEDPKGIPQNLVPFVAQVAIGIRDKVSIFGNDYPTPDGTGVRDYIHIMDLADAHVVALAKVLKQKDMGVVAYNIGTGKGSSVLDVIAAFEKVAGKKIPFVMAPRRPGDVASAYCDPAFARDDLGFLCKRTLEDACRDFWNWTTLNPNGYRKSAEESNIEVKAKRKAKVFTLFGDDKA